ncbi:zinc finger protein Xfin isoform X1 [Hydra vulgaris]|uniref:zinc finger protein Xfin isoform X1 n=2 Tax=Hydra vulgaris TaxID=6087 RepID=UPI0006410CE4|nr:zinc finger protein Xfin isoform X1 [Hydra vulgaris]
MAAGCRSDLTGQNFSLKAQQVLGQCTSKFYGNYYKIVWEDSWVPAGVLSLVPDLIERYHKNIENKNESLLLASNQEESKNSMLNEQSCNFYVKCSFCNEMIADSLLQHHEKDHLTFSNCSNTSSHEAPLNVLVVTVANQYHVMMNEHCSNSLSTPDFVPPLMQKFNCITREDYDNQFESKLINSQDKQRVPQYDCSTCHRKFFSKELFSKHIELHAESLKLKSLRSSNRKDLRNKLLIADGSLCVNNVVKKNRLNSVESIETKGLCQNDVLKNDNLVFQKKRRVCDDIPPIALQAAKRYIKTVMLRKKQEQYLSGRDDFFSSDEQAAPITSVVNGRQAYGCKVCKKVFYNKFHHREHYNVHSGEMPYNCEFCSKRFRQRSGWNRHIKLHHKYKVFSGPIPNPVVCATKNLNLLEYQSENICEENNESPNTHVEANNQTEPFVLDKEETSTKLLIHPLTRNFLCDFNKNNTVSFTKPDFDYCGGAGCIGCTNCIKSYIEKYSSGKWTGIKLTVNNDKSNDKHKSSNNLKQSMSLMASDYRLNTECEKDLKLESAEIKNSFNSLSGKFLYETSPSKIQKKGRKFRSGREKRFECGICFRKFLAKSHLNDHKMIHTGEFPYKCKFCNRPFRHKSGMNSHHKRHIEKGIFNRPIRSSDKDLLNPCLQVENSENDLETIKQKSKQKRKTRVPKQVKQADEETNSFISTADQSVLQINKDQRFSCNFCSRIFPIRTAYLKHMNNSHKSTALFSSQSNILNETTNKNIQDKIADANANCFYSAIDIKQELDADA